MKFIQTLSGIILMTSGLFAGSMQGWDFQYEVNLPGTRSESITGRLLYNGIELPKDFMHVITPIGEYMFHSLGYSERPIKWLPAALREDGKYDAPRREKDIQRFFSGEVSGFRKCPVVTQDTAPSNEAYIPRKFEERPKQAGADWFYAVKQGWWVNPKKMDEVVKTLSQNAEKTQRWSYQYEVHLPGTRSESISGKLLYNGVELSKEFEHVITPIGEYVFKPYHGFGGPPIRWVPHSAMREEDIKKLLAGKDASFRRTVVTTPVTKSSNEAYISGKFEERPKQAGSDWFYAVKQGWWVNPKKIDEAIKELARSEKK